MPWAIELHSELRHVLAIRHHKIEMSHQRIPAKFKRKRRVSVDYVGDTDLAVHLCPVTVGNGLKLVIDALLP